MSESENETIEILSENNSEVILQTESSVKKMSNPKNFCRLANREGVFYEHLLEGKECQGSTNIGRLFKGNSSRGGIHSSVIDNWINTFEFVRNNPDSIDKDIPKPFNMVPLKEYFDFVKRIEIPIPEIEMELWKKLSKKKLALEAPKYDINRGTKNAKSLDKLCDKMLEMYERRKKNIWGKVFEKVDETSGHIVDYNMYNVPELRQICKDRNIENAHIKKKEELVKLLEEQPLNTIYDGVVETDRIEYSKLNLRELKGLAKERGFNEYNNSNKDTLIKLHEEYDAEMKRIDEEREKENESVLDTFEFEENELRIVRYNNEPWFVAKDICEALGISQVCRATENLPDNWKGVKVIHTLGGNQEMTIINEPALYKIIMRSNKPNAQVFQNKVCEEILPSIRKKGYYKLEEKDDFPFQDNRPTIRRILDLSELDIEAELLEIEYDWTKWTNKCVLYIVYIGDGFIKLGFSDHKLDKRELKHQSSESNFKQYRMVKVIEISGKIAEDKMKELLNVYRVKFHNQHEIFKPPSTIANFIENVENLLGDNDLHMIISRQQQEIAELKMRVCEMEKKNLELQLQVR